MNVLKLKTTKNIDPGFRFQWIKVPRLTSGFFYAFIPDGYEAIVLFIVK